MHTRTGTRAAAGTGTGARTTGAGAAAGAGAGAPGNGARTGRREQILREAARLFADRGFHGVGVDEIGAAVGISGPGLYRHFAGKDAMLAELLVGISERLLAGGRMRIEEADGPEQALDALVRGHIDFALDDRPLITLHDRELDRLREDDRKQVRRLQRAYVELWVQVVRELRPGLGETEARVAVHAVFGLLNSTPHLGTRGGLPGRDATADLLHRLALGALAAADGDAGDGDDGDGSGDGGGGGGGAAPAPPPG
ncbi:TetR family transcriptional regulator [Streptomyces sp. SCUT-3]|uniref:SACE_7040 family transcriptional regulator n=1 Tax=Streptomyces TaxID=1883 RepID=UPI0015FDEFE0|nr:TetR/AcrR family transcriptional regulator [Streptomyces sp. SCUT-3]QMV23311.1 TetR family transcriptional regulator [Streptomyces sp. SCUT-3]